MDTATATTGCPFAHGVRSQTAPTGPRTADTKADTKLIAEVDAWCDAPERDGLELARLVAAHVRAVGKHFLPRALLARLARIRREHGSRDRYLDAFLHGVLDKYEDRYYNATYISLPLLDELLADPNNRLERTTLAAALMADVVRHETSATDRSGAPDERTRRTRITHALRFIAMCDGTTADDLRPVGLSRLPGQAGAWLELTVLPVYAAHDEYFFIRALQAHEMTYRSLTSYVRAATIALRNGSAPTAITHLGRANEIFARSAGLFRLVATMRVEQFHAFRDYTQGASAIQSDAYKRFELACGRPTAERLDSDAFANVPAVRTEADACPDDLSEAYLDARRAERLSADDLARLDGLLEALEAAHQRWKTTHHSLARKMLGDATGSGYTAGVPYLERCIDNRLFFRLAEHLPGSRRDGAVGQRRRTATSPRASGR